jgi:LuxR family maltose regulon positive regulatory protein
LEEVLTTFLNAVTRSSQEGILVLEDYHVLSEPRIHEMMTFLLDHLPATLHLVILSRTDPALPLARLRASGGLCELHAADLRFSSGEAAAFLKQSLPYEVSAFSDDVLQQLDTRLEGWAAGLRLFTLALSGRVQQQDIEHALSSFVGSHRTLQDYFVTEVLNIQPEPVQRFLLYTSVLSRLTGSLCNAVTGDNDGEHMLALLERKGIFLEALDDGQWYRYHALFAEAMRGEARRRFGEDMLHALSAKASLWYEQHTMLVEAIEAALQAKDMLRSADLIERHLSMEWGAINTGLTVYHIYELHTMYRWLEQLPDTLMQQHPTLCFAYASSIMFAFIMDRPSVERQMFDRFDKALRMAEEGWGSADNQVGLGNVLAFRAAIARQQGEIVQAIIWARKALEWLPIGEYMWRAICLGVVSNDEILKGQLNLARKITLEARATSEATRNRNFIRANMVMLSYVCFEQGELHLAAECYRQMLREAREVEDRDDIGQGSLGLALLAYEWNDLSNAERLAQEALEMGELMANYEFQVLSTLLLARIEHVRGQTTAAQQRYIALQARLSGQTAPMLYWYLRQVQTMQARLALAVGDHATVQRWMDSRVRDDEHLPLIYREMEALMEARWLLAREKEAEALTLLAYWLDDAQQNGRVRATLEMQVLMTLAYAARKQMHEARSLLLIVLAQASAEGYLRLFLDEGAAMATLLRTVVSYLREPSLLAYLRKILQAFGQEGQQEVMKEVAALVDPLSPQEQRVLRLLAAGRSNREIAEELVVSVNTVRSQVQSIYRKLDVNNRVAASEMARHLHLLP